MPTLDPILGFINGIEKAISQTPSQLDHAKQCVDMLLDEFEDYDDKTLSGITQTIDGLLNGKPFNSFVTLQTVNSMRETYIRYTGPPDAESAMIELPEDDLKPDDDSTESTIAPNLSLSISAYTDDAEDLEEDEVPTEQLPNDKDIKSLIDQVKRSSIKDPTSTFSGIEPSEANTAPSPPPRCTREYQNAVFVSTEGRSRWPLILVSITGLVVMLTVSFFTLNWLEGQPTDQVTLSVEEPEKLFADADGSEESNEDEVEAKAPARSLADDHVAHEQRREQVLIIREGGWADPFDFDRTEDEGVMVEETPEKPLDPFGFSEIEDEPWPPTPKSTLLEIDCSNASVVGDEVWAVLRFGHQTGTLRIFNTTIRDTDARCVFAAGPRAGKTIPAQCFQSTTLGVHLANANCPEWKLLGLH